MGRYLALGIAIEISLTKKHGFDSQKNFDLLKQKQKIIKSLNQTMDLSTYQCFKEEKEKLEFKIKKEYFEQNIYNLIDEINPLIGCNRYFLSDTDFYQNPKKTIKLKESEATYYIEYNEKLQHDITTSCPGSEYYLLKETLSDNIRIYISYIVLWVDYGKILLESDYSLLKFLNRLSRNYYQNPLWKNTLFFICD